jgi:hypothetical protein
MSRFWQSSTGEVFIGGSDGSLWQRSSDASFVHVPLPSLDGSTTPPLLTAFWPRATGDLWAIARVSDEKADYQRRYFLLHTQPATQPLPSVKVMDRKAQEVRMPGPPDPNCPTPFVLLYTLSKQAPANYTYPATRAALEGNADLQWSATFVEFERDGRRFFGAKVDDFSVGKTLAKLVEHKVPGSTPQLACHDPVVTRTLGIDLTTGELVNDTKTPAHD